MPSYDVEENRGYFRSRGLRGNAFLAHCAPAIAHFKALDAGVLSLGETANTTLSS
jgi:hypothetical protein